MTHRPRLLMHSLKGCPSHLLFSLLTFKANAAQKLFTYCPSSLSIVGPPTDVPWPVQWIMCNFSPKYRLVSGNKPDVSQLSACLGKQLQKIRKMNYGADVINWFNAFRSKAIHNAVGLAGSSAWQSNVFPLLKYSLKLMKNLPYCIVRNDKSPGFTFVHFNDLQQVEEAALKLPLYRPTLLSSIPWNSLRDTYKRLASRVAQLTDQRNQFLKIASSAGSGLAVSFLGMTCKTHKEPGAVSMRTIHKGLSPSFEGLSRWIVSILKPHLDLPWIKQDTAQFTKSVSTVSIRDFNKSCALDLKDFYLSGEATGIALSVSKLFSGAMKSLVFDAIFFLVDNQYVITYTLPSLYKCSKGSGIGLLHAAHLTSAFFVQEVEKHAVGEQQEVSQAYGIKYYARYHDDIFCIAHTIGHLRRWIAKLRSHCSPDFVVECRAIGSIQAPVDFLDVTVSLVSDYVKVTPSQNKVLTPLCPTSGHTSTVHASWPKSLVYRFDSISTHDMELSLARLHQRYKYANAHPRILSYILNATKQLFSSDNAVSHNVEQPEIFSIVCGYHPVYKTALNRALRHVPPPPTLSKRVLLSWKNVLKSVGSHCMAFRFDELEIHGNNVLREGELFLSNNLNLQLIHRNGVAHPVGSDVLSLSNFCAG